LNRTRLSAPWQLPICLVLISAIAATFASAQTAITPTTSTIQFSGTPGAGITQPDGAIVMYGTAISPVTNQPVRHLWVADSSAGICRVDPDLDSADPYAINLAACPFSATKVTGGTMAFDSGHNLLYFVDNRSATRGVFRISYSPAGDGGNGSFDFSSTFSMGGNSTADTFPSQTGCPFPGNNPQLPNSVALDSAGNLWVGFGRNGEIIRFNNPSAATAANFGTCASFIQIVAATPDNHLSNGLAWIGHDLWSSDGKGPFFIRDADTSCLVSPNAACTDKSGTRALTSITTSTVVMSDQVYPATNGNNLYFALSGNLVWVGNVAAGSAGQTVSSSYINTAQLASTPANIRALTLDATDPANLVVYAGDDPSAIGTVGVGRWFQTMQTAGAPGVPGAPLHVVAAEVGTDALINWSPAQVAQPVTSYTVHNSFASNGSPLADVVVAPASGNVYPPTSIDIPGLSASVAYEFQVLATNAQGSSAYSAPSNRIPLGITLPGTPSAVQATAGDAQAAVKWTLPQSVNGITSYTVSALVNGVATGIISTVAAPAPGSSTGSAIVSGLTNSTSYTFTVHATSAVGNGSESAPSLPVTPLISNVPNTTIVVNGPPNVASVPTQVTYTVTVTDASLFPIFNVNLSNVLSSTDGAFIVSAVSDSGTCSAVGSGITQTICNVPSMAPGQVLNITVVAQMNAAAITLTSTVTAFDTNGSSLTFSKAFRTSQPTVQPPPQTLPTISVPVAGSAIPSTIHPSDTGILTWTVSNGTNTTANNVVFTITVDPLLAINSVTVTPATGANPATCSAPAPGLGGNVVICTIARLGKAINAQSMTMTLGVTAPPPPANFQFIPSGTVKFDGIDSSNSTATLIVRVK
jgi:hypothetical protein